MPLLPLDEWIVEQMDLLAVDVVEAYKHYDFGTVINAIHNFCAKELSKQYLDCIKDRMYCEAAQSDLRKSGQIACKYVLTQLVKLAAPILVHTAEETWEKMGELSTIHAAVFDEPTEDRLQVIEGSDLQNRFATVWGVREDVFVAFEQWKGTDGVKDTQDTIVTIIESPETLAILQTFGTAELAILFKMSWVELQAGEPSVSFQKSPYLRCERSRLRRPDVEMVGDIPLTKRDRQVIGL